jgi:Reverse transcriptase (RNA-dependent DNA polymerase)/Type II intron maturase
LEIIRRDIHDGRLVQLIANLLEAGYMEDWRCHDTLNGTPQGGIISPLLANIYLNELDRFVEDTLVPAYTRGDRRTKNPDYSRCCKLIAKAKRREDFDEVKRLRRERRSLLSVKPVDPDHRRLRYIRYADDFLLGFVGPKNEAEDIRRRLGEYLEQRLKLTLSAEKTLITHAVDDRAKFLGYEVSVTRKGDLLTGGQRTTNGRIVLRMPRKVVQKYLSRYSKKGKIIHRKELTSETDYTIIQRYQGVLQGVYNYYCMAINVGTDKRMGYIRWVLETSLAKTLANKFRCRMTDIFKKYRVEILDRKALQVVIQRADKAPLVATFGGFPFKRIPEGKGVVDFRLDAAWHRPASKRSEVVQRLQAGRCELCGRRGVAIEVHHIRKLADIDRPGRRPREEWERKMSAMKRKTLVVCEACHTAIHGGRYDGPAL